MTDVMQADTTMPEEAPALSTLTWSDVTYGVGKGKGSKEILKGISGSLSGGEVCAIPAPRAGKTSMLNVLASRIGTRARRTCGRHRPPRRAEDRRRRAAQAHRLRHADLLAAERARRCSSRRCSPSAACRCRRRSSGDDIKDLGLTDCADTFGDEMIRGISGGEKKWTAIGIELS